jgi:RimJ/RimL family protein N-acetyltransferase
MLSVREIQQSDIDSIINYWLNSGDEHMKGMGVDLTKMPTREQWEKMLPEQLSQPYDKKKSYCIIWQVDGQSIGHSNVNNIIYGQEAFMHLHMWKTTLRKQGIGAQLVRMTIPYFFDNLKLKVVYCEPYALNPAPNKTLPKAGFEFVKEYRTIPSMICSEQSVNRWMMTYEKYKSLK